MRLDATPSANHRYSTKAITRVISVRGSDALQLPESLLKLEWAIQEQPDGVAAARFDEDGVARACSAPHDFVQKMIRTQLKREKKSPHQTSGDHPPLSLVASMGLEIGENTYHKCDIALVNGGICYSFYEFKTSASSGCSVWDQFPFINKGRTYDVLEALPMTVQNLLSQVS